MISSNPASSPNPGIDPISTTAPETTTRQLEGSVLVTGAAGLVGSRLVRDLGAMDVSFRGLDLQPAMSNAPGCGGWDIGNLLDPAACLKCCEGIDTIVHTAALQHGADLPAWGRTNYFQTNVEMTRNLVDAAIAAGVKSVVFVSSDMVYGIPRGRAFREDDQPRPIGPYGRSKLESERICLSCRQHGIAVTVLRPRLILGQGRLGILKKLFDRVRQHRVVPFFGDGSNRYQMISVADVANACLLALKTGREGTFNLGSSDPPTVKNLLSDLCRRAGSRSKLRSLPAPPARAALWALHAIRLDPLTPEQFRIAETDYVLDTTRAEEELGWTAKDHDSDMLFEAYQSYVRHSSAEIE